MYSDLQTHRRLFCICWTNHFFVITSKIANLILTITLFSWSLTYNRARGIRKIEQKTLCNTPSKKNIKTPHQNSSPIKCHFSPSLTNLMSFSLFHLISHKKWLGVYYLFLYFSLLYITTTVGNKDSHVVVVAIHTC